MLSPENPPASRQWVPAVHGVDTVVHLASSPSERGVDVDGTRYLLVAAQEAGVSHLVYMSIVGVDKREWYYYSAKHDCKQLVEGSGIPFSIQRATQFHDFMHIILAMMLTSFSFLMGRTIRLIGRAFGAGHNLTPDRRVGTLTWEQWVAQNVRPSK